MASSASDRRSIRESRICSDLVVFIDLNPERRNRLPSTATWAPDWIIPRNRHIRFRLDQLFAARKPDLKVLLLWPELSQGEGCLFCQMLRHISLARDIFTLTPKPGWNQYIIQLIHNCTHAYVRDRRDCFHSLPTSFFSPSLQKPHNAGANPSHSWIFKPKA